MDAFCEKASPYTQELRNSRGLVSRVIEAFRVSESGPGGPELILFGHVAVAGCAETFLERASLKVVRFHEIVETVAIVSERGVDEPHE